MGCWCSLEPSGGRFNDGMAPVSMERSGWAAGVRAGGGSAAGGTKCSAGIDVTRENSTKRSSGHHLGSSFSMVRVMGARSIAFASCPPATRRPAAESGGGVAGVERPAAHRYRSSAGLRVRFGGRPGSVVLEGRRRRGPGGRPVKVDAVESASRNRRLRTRNFCEKRFGTDMHPTVAHVRTPETPLRLGGPKISRNVRRNETK